MIDIYREGAQYLTVYNNRRPRYYLGVNVYRRLKRSLTDHTRERIHSFLLSCITRGKPGAPRSDMAGATTHYLQVWEPGPWRNYIDVSDVSFERNHPRERTPTLCYHLESTSSPTHSEHNVATGVSDVMSVRPKAFTRV